MILELSQWIWSLNEMLNLGSVIILYAYDLIVCP